jgi:hypothetical protein
MGLMSFCRNEIAIAKNISPQDCISKEIKCGCFAPEDLNKLYSGIVDLEFCKKQLTQKEEFIKQKIYTWEGAQPIAWWQEPEIIVSGFVVTVSVTALVTFILTR